MKPINSQSRPPVNGVNNASLECQGTAVSSLLSLSSWLLPPSVLALHLEAQGVLQEDVKLKAGKEHAETRNMFQMCNSVLSPVSSDLASALFAPQSWLHVWIVQSWAVTEG